MIRKLVMCTMLFVLACPATAQEITSEYQFHGFSDDLRYAILEVYAGGAIEDDPGTTKFVFVDVDNNSYAINPINYTGKQGMAMDVVRKNGRSLADASFKQFNVGGEKTGTSLPLQKEDNATADTQVFIINGKRYTLMIKSIPTGEKIVDTYDKVMLDLSISLNGKTQILQKDKSLPRSRSNVMGYELKAVYYIGNKLAVVVEYHVGPGFEGYPDKYDMLITGALK